MSDYQGNIVIKNPATPTGPFENGSAPGVWKLSEVLPFVRQGIWPTQGIAGKDPFFPYVSLLLSTTSLGNANNNLFVDSSGAFNPISRNGNTTQGSFTPYGASWSNFFNGGTDRIQVPVTSNMYLGTTYTIEAWAYYASSSYGARPIFSQMEAFQGGFAGLTLTLNTSGNLVAEYRPVTSGTVTTITGPTVVPNTWFHIALVSNSSSARLYVNGTQVGSTTTFGDYPSAKTNTVAVGSWGSGWNDGGIPAAAWIGYISNMRVVKGVAVYTSNFTPSTAPLTAISGTVLLTCQSNRFIDNSSVNNTLTPVGSTAVTEFSPFAPAYPGISYNQSDIQYWSGYFDGVSNAYVTFPNNSALDLPSNTSFTIEGWIFPTRPNNGAQSGFRNVVSKRVASSLTSNYNIMLWFNSEKLGFFNGSTSSLSSANIPQNAWTHFAYVYNGATSLRLYINGTLDSTFAVAPGATNSAPVTIGSLVDDTGTNDNFGGYISNIRIVKGSQVYTANFTPSTTPLTAISGTSLLTCQNAAFTDNSTNNFVATIFANATVTGNNPFQAGYYSNYFDGSNDYLSAPSNTAFDCGTGDWTIEGWVNIATRTTNYPAFFSNNRGAFATSPPGLAITVSNSDSGSYNDKFVFAWGSGGFSSPSAGSAFLLVANATNSNNTWYHLAAVRNGTSIKMYRNGTEVASATISAGSTFDWGYNGALIGGGNWDGANSYMNGYVSNFRFVKGTAVYTAAFTPPTLPLTAISGTSLLTCQSGRFIDNSTNAFTITRNGDVSVQSFDPFYTATIASNGGSMYFDGSGDYLSAPSSPAFNLSTGNYTVEFFIYTSSTASQMVFDTIQPGISGGGSNRFYVHTNTSQQIVVGPATNTLTSSSSIQLGAWNHVAVVRSGTTRTIYINGVSAGSSTQSENLSSSFCTIGFDAASGGSIIMNGYLSSLRVTKGTALYTANFTPPTAPLTPTAATTLLTNGMNAGAYDATAINNMETAGNAGVSTAVSKFGGSSMAFDGTGDGLLGTNSLVGYTSGNFTWECWVNFNSLSGNPCLIATSSGGDRDVLYFDATNGIRYAVARSSVDQISIQQGSTSGWATGTWYHVALVRNGNTYTIYRDGTSVATGTSSYAKSNLNVPVTLGYSNYSLSYLYLNGYIDDARITNGVARYTANFTPPTQAFPPY